MQGDAGWFGRTPCSMGVQAEGQVSGYSGECGQVGGCRVCGGVLQPGRGSPGWRVPAWGWCRGGQHQRWSPELRGVGGSRDPPAAPCRPGGQGRAGPGEAPRRRSGGSARRGRERPYWERTAGPAAAGPGAHGRAGAGAGARNGSGCGSGSAASYPRRAAGTGTGAAPGGERGRG